jgi:sulfopyruvate decarboxylase subunit alpha
MRVDVADGLREELWYAPPDRVYADPRWLRAGAGRPGPAPLTVRVSDSVGAVTALAYADREGDGSEAYNLRRLLLGDPAVFPWAARGAACLDELIKAGGPGLVPNLTVALPGYDAGVTATPQAGPAHLRALVDALVEIAGQRGGGTCALLYVPRIDTVLIGVLRAAGFAQVALTSRARLRVEWDDLDGYVARFPANRRHRLRGELRRIARAGVTSALADPAAEVATMVRLRGAHLRKFGRTGGEAGERQRIEDLIRQYGGSRLALILTGRGGNATSCSLYLRTGSTVTVLLAATDPRAGAPFSHYENTFYAPARLGLTRRGDVVDYGISHLEHKTIRGCEVLPLDGWVRCDDEASMAAVRRIGELSMAHSIEAPGPARQVDVIARAGVDFVTGVPDSELAPLFGELVAADCPLRYVAATREDNAVALAAGAALAGATPLVVMKSMGLGNAIDALTSLAGVYELPMVLYLSWAGHAGRDVPHHNALGEVLEPVLTALRIPYTRQVIGRTGELAEGMRRAVATARSHGGPVALLGVPAALAGGDADAA